MKGILAIAGVPFFIRIASIFSCSLFQFCGIVPQISKIRLWLTVVDRHRVLVIAE
jgi:hypothetical protein